MESIRRVWVARVVLEELGDSVCVAWSFWRGVARRGSPRDGGIHTVRSFQWTVAGCGAAGSCAAVIVANGGLVVGCLDGSGPASWWFELLGAVSRATGVEAKGSHDTGGIVLRRLVPPGRPPPLDVPGDGSGVERRRVGEPVRAFRLRTTSQWQLECSGSLRERPKNGYWEVCNRRAPVCFWRPVIGTLLNVVGLRWGSRRLLRESQKNLSFRGARRLLIYRKARDLPYGFLARARGPLLAVAWACGGFGVSRRRSR